MLTLTPFYPSTDDPSQGSFISEPLRSTSQSGMRNRVIAVQPFYHRSLGADNVDPFCTWRRYAAIPGNTGLAFAGDLLAATLTRQVRRLHSQEPFDLIHAHAPLPCGHAAMLLSKKLRIPFVVSVHGLDAFSVRQAGPVWGKWCRAQCARVYRAARAVICVSQKVANQVAQCREVTSVVVHNGVDESLFSPGPEAAPLTVLSVGNLIPIKGHELLLRAFAQASISTPDCRLEIIGDGPAGSRLLGLAHDLGIATRVSFRGKLGRQDVANAMKRCAVFALPSSYEGLGCVYLEAMSSAKPAIGCLGQGIEEIIENGGNGLLISPGSQEKLSSALRILLSDRSLRVRLGSAARATILQQHTLEHQSAQLVQLYRRCVA